MKFKWRVPAEEKLLNANLAIERIPSEEIGVFEILTNNPFKLKEGKGTVMIYIQGVDVKYGREDLVGNSPLSWLEEVVFAPKEDREKKTARIPIQHTVQKLGFDHFIPFVFPDQLTDRGFRASMKNLLNYLRLKSFTTAVVSFSTGGTVISEWLLDSIRLGEFDDLKDFLNTTETLICGGCPCDAVDLEPAGRRSGQIIMSQLAKPFVNNPLVGKHPFVSRAGGNNALLSRLKYLLNLHCSQKAKEISNENWEKARSIFEDHPQYFISFLIDTAQRVILPTGALRWYQMLYPQLKDQILGYVARNVQSGWVEVPTAHHGEVKQLWSLIALLGYSDKLKKELSFNPMAIEVAHEWPKRRFVPMEYFDNILEVNEKPAEVSKKIITKAMSV